MSVFDKSVQTALDIIAPGHVTAKSDIKRANDYLNRAYDAVRKEMFEEQIRVITEAANGDNEKYREGIRDMVDIPFNLFQYRTKKHSGAFVGRDDLKEKVERLFKLREQVSATPVVKKPSKASQEALIRERSEINNIAAEFDVLKPSITQDYIDQVRNGFTKTVETYENDWAKINRISVYSPDYRRWSFVRRHLRSVDGHCAGRNSEMEINEEYLTKCAKNYADDQVAAFVAKLSLKLVDLENVELRNVSPHSFEFNLVGRLNNKTVNVVQSIKYGVSKLGTPYVQWPALIYVEGQRVSEKEFQQMTGE